MRKSRKNGQGHPHLGSLFPQKIMHSLTVRAVSYPQGYPQPPRAMKPAGRVQGRPMRKWRA